MRPTKLVSARRRFNQRGSAIVEGALTLVIFISLFVGTLELGQILMIHQAIVERVRYAARVTAVNCCDTTTVQNLVLYGQATLPSSPNPFYGLSAANINVTFSDQKSPDQRVTIAVRGYNFVSVTPMMAGYSNGIPITVSFPLEQP